MGKIHKKRYKLIRTFSPCEALATVNKLGIPIYSKTYANEQRQQKMEFPVILENGWKDQWEFLGTPPNKSRKLSLEFMGIIGNCLNTNENLLDS